MDVRSVLITCAVAAPFAVDYLNRDPLMGTVALAVAGVALALFQKLAERLFPEKGDFRASLFNWTIAMNLPFVLGYGLLAATGQPIHMGRQVAALFNRAGAAALMLEAREAWRVFRAKDDE